VVSGGGTDGRWVPLLHRCLRGQSPAALAQDEVSEARGKGGVAGTG
jgi:hypothetical protein